MRADSILRSSRWDPAVVFASFGANLLSLVVPMSMIHLYDRIIPNMGYETLTALGIVVFGAVLAEVVLRSTRRFLLERAGEAFEFRNYRAVFSCIVNADASQGEKFSRGRLISSVNSIERLRSIHTGEVALAILDLPFACLFMATVILISPLAGGIVAGILAVTFLILRVARSKTLQVQNRKREFEERRYSFLAETLAGVEAIKSMHIEDAMQRRYERLMGQTAKVSAELAKISHFAQGFTAIVGAFSPVVIACVGAFLVIEAQITVGALAALILLTGRIIQPALRVEAYFAGLSITEVERNELEDVLAMPLLASGEMPLNRIDTLTLTDVAVEAKDETPFAFVGVNLELKRGECVVIKGPNRRACSAFLQMLLGEMRLHGEYAINGRSFSKFNLADRYRRMRYVSRDQNLMPGTFLENLCGFNVVENQDDAMILAHQLGLSRTFATSAEGFDIEVGQASKSRLTKSISDTALIISALVSKPDVLLFDHANASLDLSADARLLEALSASMKDRITLICSDRPSYLRLASRTVDITPFVVRTAVQNDAPNPNQGEAA